MLFVYTLQINFSLGTFLVDLTVSDQKVFTVKSLPDHLTNYLIHKQYIYVYFLLIFYK